MKDYKLFVKPRRKTSYKILVRRTKELKNSKNLRTQGGGIERWVQETTSIECKES